MIEFLDQMLSYSFMQRALAVTTLLSFSIVPVGAFLVLRRLSLAGEAMAHAITPGIVIAFVWAGLSVMSLLVGGLIAGFFVAFATAFLGRKTLLRSDAALASLYLIALAVGIFILSASGSAVPLKSFLFGSILGIDDASFVLVACVATITLAVFAVILRPLIMSTCDPVFFEAQYPNFRWLDHLFMLLVVLNLIAAFKTLGTLMAVGLMILPATSARYWVNTISGQLGLGLVFALLSCWLGLVASYLLPSTPAGPGIILVASIIFTISAVSGRHGLVSRSIQSRGKTHQQQERT